MRRTTSKKPRRYGGSSETRLAWPTVQGMGIVEIGRRDFGRAEELHEESLALAREAGNDSGIMFALALGALAALQDEHGQVRTLCAEGLGSPGWRD